MKIQLVNTPFQLFARRMLAVAIGGAFFVSANAEEFHLPDYVPLEAVGSSLDYRMFDSDGQTVGDLTEEVVEEEADGFFRTELVSNLGDMTGTASFWQRFNSAGERIVDRIEFSTEYDGMVLDAWEIDYDEPTENFSTLSLGESGTMSTTFTEVSYGWDGQPQQRTGTVHATTTLEAVEEITVPAGTFDTIRLRHEDTLLYDDDPENPVVEEELHWYAKGIGRVFRVFMDADQDESHHGDELVDFSGLEDPGGPAEPGESFSEWLAAYDLPAGQDTLDADPSGDGVPNAIKYALGLDPTSPSRDQLPIPEYHEAEGEKYLMIEIHRNEAAEDAEIIVEFSGGLTGWTEGSAQVVEDSDSLLRVRDTVPASAGERRFGRFRVEVGE